MITGLWLRQIGPALQDFSERYQLTKRELEILILIAAHGASNGEMAERCVISEKTVQNHLANMMKKTGTRSIRKLLSLLFNYIWFAHESNASEDDAKWMSDSLWNCRR